MHKRPLLLLLLCLALGRSIVATAFGVQTITLAWDSNPEPDVAGYQLYYGPSSGFYTGSIAVQGGTSADVSNLSEGGTYYFAVAAYNNDGIEGLPSAELAVTIAGVPPTPTPSPTATPIPAATPTPTPVATPIPTPTPVATPSPTAGPIRYLGYFDQVSCDGMTGWLAQLDTPDAVLKVDVYIDGLKIATIDANLSRKDLVPFGYGEFHGFSMATPANIKDGKPHVVSIRPAGGTTDLAFLIPLSVTCAAPIATPAPTPIPAATPLAKTLLNVSTRCRVEGGDNVMIGGLIFNGAASKKVVLRAIGPSLASFGVTGVLRDPVLTLYDGSGNVVATNDNWRTNAAALNSVGFAPTDDREAATVATLAPGAYTIVLSSADGTPGVALLEMYDLQSDSTALANIATRGKIYSGENVMIAGFIVGGTQPSDVIIRGIGPSLARAGVANALADPAVELYSSQGTKIFGNDSWRTDQAQQIAATGLAPTDDREAAIMATLPPGSYTAVLRGGPNATGVGLVEVYNLSR